MKKRLLSAFMALVLCLTLLPAPAWAEEADAPEGGTIVQEEQEETTPATSEQAVEDTTEGGTIVQEEQEEATTEGNGQSTNTGEGEQSNSETNTLTEIWFVRKPDSIGRSYDGTTDGSMVSFGTPQFTDGTNTFELTEGTDFTAKKAFDSADAGNHTVSVEFVSSVRRHKALVSVCSATLTAAVQVLYEIRQIEGILLFCQKQRSIILPVDDPVDNPDILAVRNHHIGSACGCDGGSSQLG